MAVIIDPTAASTTTTLAIEIPAKLAPYIEWFQTHIWVLALIIIWCMVWKGLALYRAGTNKSIRWFLALFLLNTSGILEIIYLFGPGKKKK